jgi:glycosyltransferase involved in cell wall biosynthesis
MGPSSRQRPDPLHLLIAPLRRAGTLRAVLRNAHADPSVEGRPLISVVLPTYNWSSVLRHAIHSVLWQTYTNFELLVIGDGCTDDSEQVVTSFNDERIRWHNLRSNSGSLVVPNNTGIELARGEYIAYQGHDDIWHPRHLAALLAGIQGAQADLAYSLAEVLGPPESRVRFLSGRVAGKDLVPGDRLPPTSILHRTELAARAGGWQTWKEGAGQPNITFLARALESGALPVRVPALTAFKFPADFRPNSYRDRPSHEQEAYLRRIQGERLFIERQLVALALRRLSPRKPHLQREEPTPQEMFEPQARLAYLRRVRGLD